MTTEVFQRLDEVLEGVGRRGVVHVGAHRGQELADYVTAGFELVVLVEPNPGLYTALVKVAEQAHPVRVMVFPSAAGQAGSATLHVTMWDERSSLLTPLDDATVHYQTVQVVPLAEMQDVCNVAVLDVQGAELDVLRTANLETLDVVVVECCDRARYLGAAVRAEIEEFMLAAGWHQAGVFGGHSAADLVDVVWRRRCE